VPGGLALSQVIQTRRVQFTGGQVIGPDLSSLLVPSAATADSFVIIYYGPAANRMWCTSSSCVDWLAIARAGSRKNGV